MCLSGTFIHSHSYEIDTYPLCIEMAKPNESPTYFRILGFFYFLRSRIKIGISNWLKYLDYLKSRQVNILCLNFQYNTKIFWRVFWRFVRWLKVDWNVSRGCLESVLLESDIWQEVVWVGLVGYNMPGWFEEGVSRVTTWCFERVWHKMWLQEKGLYGIVLGKNMIQRFMANKKYQRIHN